MVADRRQFMLVIFGRCAKLSHLVSLMTDLFGVFDRPWPYYFSPDIFPFSHMTQIQTKWKMHRET